MALKFDDMIPRYLPDQFGGSAVTGTTFYPPGVDRPDSPIRDDCGALEVRTVDGIRWIGCDRAYINADLRFVVIGCDSRDVVRKGWEPIYTYSGLETEAERAEQTALILQGTKQPRRRK